MKIGTTRIGANLITKGRVKLVKVSEGIDQIKMLNNPIEVLPNLGNIR